MSNTGFIRKSSDQLSGACKANRFRFVSFLVGLAPCNCGLKITTSWIPPLIKCFLSDFSYSIYEPIRLISTYSLVREYGDLIFTSVAPTNIQIYASRALYFLALDLLHQDPCFIIFYLCLPIPPDTQLFSIFRLLLKSSHNSKDPLNLSAIFLWMDSIVLRNHLRLSKLTYPGSESSVVTLDCADDKFLSRFELLLPYVDFHKGGRQLYSLISQ